MNRVFADTWFFLAILNPTDPHHAQAKAVSRNELRHRVTTDWVVLEIGDALSKQANRDTFIRFYDWIQQHSGTTIVPASRQLLEEGAHLYGRMKISRKRSPAIGTSSRRTSHRCWHETNDKKITPLTRA